MSEYNLENSTSLLETLMDNIHNLPCIMSMDESEVLALFQNTGVNVHYLKIQCTDDIPRLIEEVKTRLEELDWDREVKVVVVGNTCVLDNQVIRVFEPVEKSRISVTAHSTEEPESSRRVLVRRRKRKLKDHHRAVISKNQQKYHRSPRTYSQRNIRRR